MIATILSLFVSQTILAATPRTPSQALPKMFQKPSSVDYYEMKRQEAIIPKIVATEFTDDGEVEGPGTGTSDSIPALLSDGEFVFTAKSVKHIGVDKLRKMMKDAEAAYDAGMKNQEAYAAMAE